MRARSRTRTAPVVRPPGAIKRPQHLFQLNFRLVLLNYVRVVKSGFLSFVLVGALLAQQPPPNPPPGAAGQQPPGAAGKTPGAAAPANAAAPPQRPGQLAPIAGPVSLTLEGAVSRARAYNAQFVAALTAYELARQDVVQARAARFPTLNALNQYIYTQGNGTPSGVFVANDGVHIYNEQALVHQELFSITRRAEYRRALAAEAAARARQEIAQRGLVATVVQSYYGLAAAERHLANAQRSLTEAQHFLDITQKQEHAGEVAGTDVIKAQLLVKQRTKDVEDAQVAVEKGRVALGVLLFPDVNQEFNLMGEPNTTPPLPTFEEFRQQALARSPDVRAAESALQAAKFAVTSARGAYYPSLMVDYFYGIDSNVVALRDPDGRRNIGSALQATVTVPVWNWGATRSRVEQARILQKQAQFDVTAAQRILEADIRGFYLEAQAARNQLDLLRQTVQLSEESLRLTLLRYEAGESTALEVSDAETTLTQARNAYDDGVLRYRVALAELQTLTGNL